MGGRVGSGTSPGPTRGSTLVSWVSEYCIRCFGDVGNIPADTIVLRNSEADEEDSGSKSKCSKGKGKGKGGQSSSGRDQGRSVVLRTRPLCQRRRKKTNVAFAERP